MSAWKRLSIRHRGQILEAQVNGDPLLDIVDQDVHGVILADGLTTDQLSPVALEALRQVPSYRPGTLREERTGTFDAVADAAYFPLVDRIGTGESVENTVIERPNGTIVLDFDSDGHLLGVEVLEARALLREETIRELEQIA